MSYKIRKSMLEDMAAIESAHRRSIREVCSKDYSEEEIRGWSNVNYDKDLFNKNITEEFHYVIEKEGNVEGCCHARYHGDGLGEIMGLYLSPEVIGMGAGRVVFEKAIEYLKDQNAEKVVITGTRTAKGFYKRMGFKQVCEEKLYDVRGVKIGCFQMEMKLD